MSRPTRTIGAVTLRGFVEALFRSAGCGELVASQVADVFVEADLRGIGLQGLDHVPTILAEIRAGKVRPAGQPTAKRDGATAVVNANRAPGPIGANFAADLAAEIAAAEGCAAVGVANGNDLYLLGYYAERIARKGLVGIALTTGHALVHPFGGTERMLGTNPIAVAVPRFGPHPFLVEMSTSALAAGRVRQAMYHGELLPDGVGVGPDGIPSRDAATVRAGAIAPMAGHKGYGLSLAIALIAGPLIGAVVGKARDDRPGWSGSPGQFYLVINPQSFGNEETFLAAVENYLQEVSSSRKADGVDKIRIPGDRAFSDRERHLRNGVPIPDAVLERIRPWASELAVPMIG